MADVLVDVKITVSSAASPLAVDASGMPNTATVGTSYNGVLKASGGTRPYTFTDVSAQQTPPATGFPPGIQLNADGTVTGTPNAGDDSAPNYDAVIDVADSAGNVVQARVAGKK